MTKKVADCLVKDTSYPIDDNLDDDDANRRHHFQGLTELDAAMLKRMEEIVLIDKRAFCVLDFRRFEIDGKEYPMANGTFRNKIGKLAKEGKVVLQFRSRHAYYSLPGHKFTKSMTENHVGGPITIGRQTPLYKWLKDRPREKQSVHDIRLTFAAAGLWDKASQKFPVDEINNDIYLESIHFSEDIDVKITIHHSDTVSIAIASSYRPFVIDIPDILYLIEIMTRIELSIAKCCDGSDVVIPRFSTWIVKMWHFGFDLLDRYDGERFHITFEEGISDLWRLYTKRMKDAKIKLRAEHQENPNKPVIDAIMDKFYQEGQIV